MPTFFGIAPGETRTAPGLRIEVTAGGERVWMHGKWLDLGPDHAVAFVIGEAEFVRPDGRRLRPGQFPCWRVDGSGRRAAYAIMLNLGQFRGGEYRHRPPRARVWSSTDIPPPG